MYHFLMDVLGVHGEWHWLVEFRKYLEGQYGYNNAVRIEDYLQIVITIIFTSMFNFFLSAYFLKWNTDYSLRASNQLKSFMYMWVEEKDRKELVFRNPQGLLDKLETIFAVWYIRFRRKDPFIERKAKVSTFVFLFLGFVMLVCMILSLYLGYFVARPHS